MTKELASHDSIFIEAHHARDSGVTHACGKRRPNNLLSGRTVKSKAGMKKLTKLATASRRARKLFTGSAFAMATWGHKTYAIYGSKMFELERDALACSGIDPAGTCRTTALVVGYGVQGTPRARVVRERVRALFSLFRNSATQVVDDIRRAWPIAREHLLQNACRIHGVKGLLSDLFYINFWQDPGGDHWAIVDGTVSLDRVAAAITGSYLNHDFVGASTHYNGLGMQHGIDVDSTFRHLRNLRRNYNCSCHLAK